MKLLEYTIAALALVMTYFNVVASIGLYRADDLNRLQKIVQGLIVWSVPFFGAWLILFLLRVNNPKSVAFRMLGFRDRGWLDMTEGNHTTWIDDRTDHTHRAGHIGHHSGDGNIGDGHGS